ncbi:MAG TPA: alpha/beta hydrolase, partial [Steroidobacteraceae bacterium]|nr:alpha/beta hydrolase [Steroidobacteraceae bacterium]
MRTIISMGLAFLCLLAAGAEAQQPPAPAMPYASRQVIPIWDGPIPGTVNPAQHESTVEVPGRGVHIVRNVTLPTLTVFPAKPGKTSRTAVVIAPGGGFRVLAIDEEGYPVAEWFSQHGITAVVLKYRLAYTPGTDKEFAPNLLAPPIPHAASGGPPANGLPEEAQKYGIADGVQAIKVVRANAASWGIDADKIVFVGFSAGGVVTSGTMLADN